MRPYYDDGTCTIYHGDCRELLPDLVADMVIADPPYGVGYRSSGNRPGVLNGTSKQGRAHKRAWPALVGDNQPFDPTPLLRFPKVVLWGANHYADRLPPSPSWIVWDKREGLPAINHSDCELAWTNLISKGGGQRGSTRMFRHMWSGVQRASEAGQPVLHPTQKPVALMAWIIDRWSKPGDLILDPYMGSGPVLQAAKDLGRRAIGIEIEERYCEIAAKRLGQEVLAL